MKGLCGLSVAGIRCLTYNSILDPNAPNRNTPCYFECSNFRIRGGSPHGHILLWVCGMPLMQTIKTQLKAELKSRLKFSCYYFFGQNRNRLL